MYSHRNDGNNNDTLEPANDETTEDQQFFAYYVVASVDGQLIEKAKIKVGNGDNIDTIRESIKNDNGSFFTFVRTFEMQLFASATSEQTMDIFEEWNPDIHWGTKESPLILKVNRISLAPPWNSEEGTCFLFISQLNYLVFLFFCRLFHTNIAENLFRSCFD